MNLSHHREPFRMNVQLYTYTAILNRNIIFLNLIFQKFKTYKSF